MNPSQEGSSGAAPASGPGDAAPSPPRPTSAAATSQPMTLQQQREAAMARGFTPPPIPGIGGATSFFAANAAGGGGGSAGSSSSHSSAPSSGAGSPRFTGGIMGAPLPSTNSSSPSSSTSATVAGTAMRSSPHMRARSFSNGRARSALQAPRESSIIEIGTEGTPAAPDAGGGGGAQVAEAGPSTLPTPAPPPMLSTRSSSTPAAAGGGVNPDVLAFSSYVGPGPNAPVLSPGIPPPPRTGAITPFSDGSDQYFTSAHGHGHPATTPGGVYSAYGTPVTAVTPAAEWEAVQEMKDSVGVLMDPDDAGVPPPAGMDYARRWSDGQGEQQGPNAAAVGGNKSDGKETRRQSGAASWLDATSNILRASFTSSSQPHLPTSMREVTQTTRGAGGSVSGQAGAGGIGGAPGFSSASSSPSFGAIRFTGRGGTMSAGPSPSMGPRRYTGLGGGAPGAPSGRGSFSSSAGGPSPPFVAARYTGTVSAGPSPMSGPVRYTGLGSISAGALQQHQQQQQFAALQLQQQLQQQQLAAASGASVVSNTSASASGTSVLSYASHPSVGGSSSSSPPPPSFITGAGSSSGGSNNGKNSNSSGPGLVTPGTITASAAAVNGMIGNRSEEEWTEYIRQGELRGRQRGLDKALEVLRERSAASAAAAAAAGGSSAATITPAGLVGKGGLGGATTIYPGTQLGGLSDTDEFQELLESRATSPDDSASSAAGDPYGTGKGRKAPVNAYAMRSKYFAGYRGGRGRSASGGSGSGFGAGAHGSQGVFGAARQMITFLPLRLARILRWIATLRTPSLILLLIIAIAFVASVTETIKYILNPDKEPKPWRLHCAQQPTFPHDLADSLAPVDLFVGVFSRDSGAERRAIIRNTYAAHTLPVSPVDGQPLSNIQVKFILGRPRSQYRRSVLLEQEMYNDIVILDMEENMNQGKTLEYFKWAAENATVPIVIGDPISSAATSSGPVVPSASSTPRNVRWKKADYVVKADDDSFVVLKELERHLRLVPRTKAYWGYLISERFMAGECYALSSDLVDYVAHSSKVEKHSHGKEDKVVASWMRMHPEADSIRYISQHCWIYDHPKAGTAYSHGFLFPDHVAEIKNEIRYGIPSAEIGRRGGLRAALSHSTVSKWKKQYKPPHAGMSMEEEIEALVEGGGRWASNGHVKNTTIVPHYPREQVVYEAADPRIRPVGTPSQQALQAHQVGLDPATGLSIYGTYADSPAFAADLMHRVRRRDLAGEGVAGDSLHSAPFPGKRLPLPTSGDASGTAAEIRKQRFQGRPHGGTIVVHFIKKNEWFMETAIALLGKEVLRTDGAGGSGSEWTMF